LTFVLPIIVFKSKLGDSSLTCVRVGYEGTIDNVSRGLDCDVVFSQIISVSNNLNFERVELVRLENYRWYN